MSGILVGLPGRSKPAARMNSCLMMLLCAAGVLVWPIFQLVHRRRSKRATRLFIVFAVTSVLLIALGVVFELTGSWHYSVPGMWLFPLVNLVSMAASILVFLTTPPHDPV